MFGRSSRPQRHRQGRVARESPITFLIVGGVEGRSFFLLFHSSSFPEPIGWVGSDAVSAVAQHSNEEGRNCAGRRGVNLFFRQAPSRRQRRRNSNRTKQNGVDYPTSRTDWRLRSNGRVAGLATKKECRRANGEWPSSACVRDTS